jgi:hypothetical protein
MPKIETKRIDGVSYNVDHAKKIGKDAFVKSNLQTHFQHLTGEEATAALSQVYDQLVAPIPITSTPAGATGAASKN